MHQQGTLGLAFASCTSKAPVKDQPSDEPAAAPDTALVSAAESNIQAHQEDIQALWESFYGEEKKIAHYCLAGDDVFVCTEDGKDGLLLSFYKDMKDIDNFETTYYEKTESEGFNELFSVTEKDGKKTYTNDDEPYDEKEAQAFIDKIAQEAVKPLADILKKWK